MNSKQQFKKPKFVKLDSDSEKNLRKVKAKLLLQDDRINVTDTYAISKALKYYLEAGKNGRKK